MNRKIGNPAQLCAVTRSMITDGPAKGARIIDVTNGKLHFVLSESNALDILRLWHEGTNVGFVSKNGLYTGEGGFMHDFPAGMVYTCGFDAIGGVEGHRPHGRLHTIPATVTGIEAGEEGVRITGEIRFSQLFGEDLVLTRTIETLAGSGEVKLTDVIENRAFRDERYCVLYHVNIGYPFLDEGARVEGNIVKTVPRTPWAAKYQADMLKVEPPEDNWEEYCYFHETKDGVMSLVNPRLGRRLTVRSNYRKFVEWKSRASGDYVVALEPCSSWLDERLRYSVLKPGRKTVNRLVLSIDDLD